MKQQRASLKRSSSWRTSAAIRKSFPELVCLSRGTYVMFLVICYSLLSSMWMESSSHTFPLDNAKLDDINTPIKVMDVVSPQISAIKLDTDRSNKVAYVVVITGCGTDLDIPFFIAEGAAVLKHSIHLNSKRYGYDMYAFYHPDGASCASTLTELGYIVQERDTPVKVADIANAELQERIVKNGCCGEKELIKFEAFTLTDYPVVVLLDLDVLVMQPLDTLFDFVLDSSKLPDPDDILRAETPIPDQIDLLYTSDYGMVDSWRKIKPTQGGFAVLRPNRTIYDDFVDIVKKGDFRFDGKGTGWGGESGRFWGAMTFQGLMPYYYQVLYPGRSVELNWCKWNNMCSPYRDDEKKGGKCLTQQENCEDCRERTVDRVALTHFTVCQKPWTCQSHMNVEDRLCREFHHSWYKTRSNMEKSWGRSGEGDGTFRKEHFIGYCSSYGTKGYQHLTKPYGTALASTPQEGR